MLFLRVLRCDETHSGPHAAGVRAFRDFAAVGHREHRTRDRAARVSAAVHDGGPRQGACATSAAKSVTECAECSSDVPRVIAPWMRRSSELCPAYQAGQSQALRLGVPGRP